jgi:carbon-monoxide dehydrogenase small subunit/xanthine dehydrogenase small subunit
MIIDIIVNHKKYILNVHPLKRLLDIIREDLKLTGTKEGCGEGECGACAVLMDGELINSCMLPAIQAHGHHFTTIEGLDDQQGEPDILQQAFIDKNGVQCGFCTPGMILAARALLIKNHHPNREKIKEALAGNLCRCTGYEAIFRAVERASAQYYGESIKEEITYDNFLSPSLSEREKEWVFIPQHIENALHFLTQHEDITILAGMTDIAPDMKNKKTHPRKILDINSIQELRSILLSEDEKSLSIGATCTNTQLMYHPLILRYLPSLSYAASQCGAVAIQNRATIGGNIITASGAADLPVILLALGAELVLRSHKGSRVISLEKFFTGYRKTLRQSNELLTTIKVPLPDPHAIQKFYKRGSRAMLTLSRISLGCYLSYENHKITKIRFAAGSMSAFPERLYNVEKSLLGYPLSEEYIKKAADEAVKNLHPRKSPAFRKEVTRRLIERFLKNVNVT